ncbi:MAG: AMP-binding protein [Prevotella sp.]|nr:AMP-binding protein [Prevotella sp.]
MSLEEFLAEWHSESPTMLVHTSGSTGRPKPMWVEKHRMEASARMTLDFLGLKAGETALLCLPLDYIAGKMMVVRSLVGELSLLPVEPTGHPLAGLDGSKGNIGFAAMVPLQVCNSLRVDVERERLRRIGNLIIGGGAIEESLEEKLRDFPNAVWSTYGMTETLSHIAMRRVSGPEASSFYTPLPGVQVHVDEEQCLVIDAPQLHEGMLHTNDIVEMTGDGRFRILGRRDNVVCSGGLKIQIEEVERRLSPYLDAAFVISKCKDERLGEVLLLLTESGDTDAVRAVCRERLPRYWQPREIRHVEKIPMTETGKPKRIDNG